MFKSVLQGLQISTNDTVQQINSRGLLKAQLLCNYIDVRDLPTLTHGRLAFLTLFLVFLNRFGRSVRFCNLEIDKEVISDGYRSENAWYRLGVLNL